MADYGVDMPEGSVIRWVQFGWRWAAVRRRPGWEIIPVHRVGIYRRLFTWEQLGDHLMRRGVLAIERHPAETNPLTWRLGLLDPPVQVECRPSGDGRRQLIPADRFPRLGAVGRVGARG